MPIPPRALLDRRRRLTVIAVLAGAGLVACIDDPRLSVAVDTSSAMPGPDAASDPTSPDMVLIPGVAVDVPGTPTPTGPGEPGEIPGSGKGGGKDKKDGGGPPGDAGAPPPPPPGPGVTHLEVAAFWIDVTEVTVDAFGACVTAGRCSAPAPGASCTFEAGLASHPVNCVTLEQARSYCAWRAKRLVGNDEWTAAAAGAELRTYPWGAAVPDEHRLNACGAECAAAGMYAGSDGEITTAPAGSFPLGRTPEGVDDLAGNVAEWVESADGTTTRGGSFEDVDVVAARSLEARTVTTASAAIGFRCAADTDER
jgi:formylglycine-generating enzyme required for sulfatase activity